MTTTEKLRHVLEVADALRWGCKGHSSNCMCYEKLVSKIEDMLKETDVKNRKVKK